MNLTIREATKKDADLIAHVVAMAMGYDLAADYAGDEDVIKVIGEVALCDDTQYSYQNALIAEIEGNPAGAIVGYDGGQLHRLREGSLSVIRRYHPDINITEDETEPGEFYLDSIGVLPEFRGQGIASRLIASMADKARMAGYARCGLLVDFGNGNAERLYSSLGFRYIGERPFFGHMMKHLQKEI